MAGRSRGPLDLVLDASVLFSFDRSGFRRHRRRFDPADLDVDLRGRVCLVTGANSGIGRATALGLARRGAAVRLLCRSEERGREAEAALRREAGHDDVRLVLLDVSSLAAVRRCAAAVADERVDVLVHNAGVLPAERRLTADGLELTFATHVAGPFVLTRLLEERLAAAGGRVVWVSSGGMYTQALSLEDLDWSARPYDGVRAYAQTKRMQVVLAGGFAERLAPRGVAVHAMHPGWADTTAVQRSLPRFHRLLERRLRTPEEGADTVLWLAAAPRERLGADGRFWFDRRPVSPYALPGTREDPEERRRLWARCERLLEADPAAAGDDGPR